MAVIDTFNAIKSILNQEKIHDCIQAMLTIEEISRQATMRKVHIASVGANSFSIKYDKCGFPGQSLFALHDSMHRACDAIAFCEVEAKPYILCFELKSSEPTRHDVTQQFRNAHCFLDYLDTLIKNYCNCDPITQWERRYFVFHNQAATPMTKRTTTDSYDNTSPEKAMFIATHTGATTYVRKLLGKPL